MADRASPFDSSGGWGYYPLLLDLRDREVVVVGGGAVATAKVRGLLEAGARVRVVSPSVSPDLASLATAREIVVIAREYRPGDLAGATLAIAATDDRAVNRAIWEEAERERILLNAVDDVQYCHFIAPSILRRGRIVVSVSSSGTSPALAVRLRERIERVVRGEHAVLADVLGELRDDVAALVPDADTRSALWYRVIDALIDQPLRDAPDARAALRQSIRALLEQLLHDESTTCNRVALRVGGAGSVHLVGAGPGDPGLLTLRGHELLRTADVIVHDRLVSDDVLALAHDKARLIDVGKRAHRPSPRQESINATLIAEARRGYKVVRLKGGDPFVFGRGGEELEALHRAGIACEVVPGVSAATAAPAAAGIPVTHRSYAPAFAVVTAQRDSAEAGPPIDWSALARIPTLVVLMGLRALPDVADRLMLHGVSADLPAAVISAATTPYQRVVRSTLGSIARVVAEAALASPATLVTGEVVRLMLETERSAGGTFEGRSPEQEPSIAC